MTIIFFILFVFLFKKIFLFYFTPLFEKILQKFSLLKFNFLKNPNFVKFGSNMIFGLFFYYFLKPILFNPAICYLEPLTTMEFPSIPSLFNYVPTRSTTQTSNLDFLKGYGNLLLLAGGISIVSTTTFFLFKKLGCFSDSSVKIEKLNTFLTTSLNDSLAMNSQLDIQNNYVKNFNKNLLEYIPFVNNQNQLFHHFKQNFSRKYIQIQDFEKIFEPQAFKHVALLIREISTSHSSSKKSTALVTYLSELYDLPILGDSRKGHTMGHVAENLTVLKKLSTDLIYHRGTIELTVDISMQQLKVNELIASVDELKQTLVTCKTCLAKVPFHEVVDLLP